MISKDKQYRTEDGREARIYATDAGGIYCVHGAIFDGNTWNSWQWREDGSSPISGFSLIEVKPRHKRTVWLNVYVDEATSVHRSKESADFHNLFRIACIRVDLDFEEGEGL